MNFWVQINTRGSWRNVEFGVDGNEDGALAMVTQMARQQPKAKWCLRYADGTRRWIHIDSESGAASIPDPPPEAA